MPVGLVHGARSGRGAARLDELVADREQDDARCRVHPQPSTAQRGSERELAGAEPGAGREHHVARAHVRAAGRTCWPATAGRCIETRAVPRSVSSSGTTASAPIGSGAPDAIRTAVPGTSRSGPPCPAGRRARPAATARSRSRHRDVSCAATAYPSREATASAGRSCVAATSAARMQPTASCSTTSSGGTGPTAASTAARWSCTDLMRAFCPARAGQPASLAGSATNSASQARKSGPRSGRSDRDLHDGLEVVEPVTGVVPAPAEHHAVHAAALVAGMSRASRGRRSAGSRRRGRARCARAPRTPRGAARTGR